MFCVFMCRKCNKSLLTTRRYFTVRARTFVEYFFDVCLDARNSNCDLVVLLTAKVHQIFLDAMFFFWEYVWIYGSPRLLKFCCVGIYKRDFLLSDYFNLVRNVNNVFNSIYFFFDVTCHFISVNHLLNVSLSTDLHCFSIILIYFFVM